MQVLPDKFKDYSQVSVYMPRRDEFSPMMNAIWSWCDKNCNDHFDALFKHFNGYKIWMFRSAEDASFFSLVWKK